MKIESGNNPHIWAWAPGTGIQHAEIPNYTTEAHILTSTNCIEVYPNPFTNFVIVDGNFNNYEIQILNASGQVVSDLSNTSSPLKINLQTLDAGIYFLRIQNLLNNDLSFERIIKN